MNSINLTYFEKSLCQKAKLFSIPKGNLDLLLVLQLNILTFHQLALTGIHGSSLTAARLSLTRLEKQGFVQGRLIPYSKTKYFTLTQKGKGHIQSFVPPSLFTFMNQNPQRRLPTGQHQLLHRIRTNDFYCSYIAGKYSMPSLWQIEKKLPQFSSNNSLNILPRCDGFLKTEYCNYYIEQDNDTQSVSVIKKKLQQYLESSIFLSETSSENALIFSLAFPYRKRSSKKPPQSIYRILLKMSKVWQTLQTQLGLELDYIQFKKVLAESPIAQTLSERDLSAFSTIKTLHPSLDNLDDVNELKRAYLNDTEYMQNQSLEMDLLFRNRLKKTFHKILETNSELQYLLRSGLQLYAVANHRINYHTFIMGREYHSKQDILRHLYYAGLNTEHWIYHFHFPITNDTLSPLTFRQVMQNQTNANSIIIVEDLLHDLGSQYRIAYYLENSLSINKVTLFVLLIESIEDAINFYNSYSSLFTFSGINISFVVLSQYHNEAATTMYVFECNSLIPITIEYDEFDNTFTLIRKEQITK